MPSDTRVDSTRLRLLTELAEASAHLAHGAADADELHDSDLSASITSVRLQSHDLMRRRMRQLRLSAGLTQKALAERAGVPGRAVADFEAGRAVVSDLVHRLGPALGVRTHVASRPEGAASVVLRAQTAVAGEVPVQFEVVASGISMEPTVRHGDLLLVTPGVALLAGRIVVAMHGPTWVVKRLAEKAGNLVLRSDNADEELALDQVVIQGTVVELRRAL